MVIMYKFKKYEIPFSLLDIYVEVIAGMKGTLIRTR